MILLLGLRLVTEQTGTDAASGAQQGTGQHPAKDTTTQAGATYFPAH
ncbi:hypothetical protein L1285_03480 [Pseudoalteromonas sp. DL2-H2.2]|nr:hypothetical protein [Pseudoalteromonas sp. DL2-H2.2]MCF2907376.1 hypothetical protein [Pseudoalteromonas sp. DL2-H2.2]